MVISHSIFRSRRAGSLTTDLVAAMSILVLAVLPIGASFLKERELFRTHYRRAAVMELVDGEMEVLLAGEWRAFREGVQPYPVRAASLANLPPGRFELTVRERVLRLEWLPDGKSHVGKVAREGVLK